jgi:hypothetical protein
MPERDAHRAGSGHTYEERLATLLIYLCSQQGEGRTSAEAAAELDWPPREVAAKLRSLASEGICETSAAWQRPARYWVRWPTWRALRIVGAV